VCRRAADRVAPGEANVASGQYRLKREVFLIAKAQPTPASANFLAFVRGPEGAAVIKANGAIPAGR
jgi:ABC-type phosphate transport system substrate-binding protein